jgi:hypothetical protein
MQDVIAELKVNKWLQLQSLVFLLLSLSFIVTNGLQTCWWGGCGLSIGQWHMHDALWHISMAKIAFNSWPFVHPFYTGANVFGYNYFIDLILFCLSKVGIDPFFAFFRLLPVLIAIFYVVMSIKFAKHFFKNSESINAVIFFLYFGNSLSYLATLYAGHTFFYASLRGFPVVTSIQPGMMFLNLQYALSLPLMLWALIHFKRSTRYQAALWFTPLLFAISGLKFYGGIVLTLVLGGMIMIRIMKRDHVTLRVMQLAAILFGDILAQILFYSKAGGDGFPFAFAPFAIPHVLLDDPVLFNNHSWTLARYFLYEHGGWRSPRLLALEGYTVFLLAIMNFGTRLIGITALTIGKIRKSLSLDDLVIMGAIACTFVMPVLFVQDGGWFNTMQFLYYGIFFASFYAGRVLGYLFVLQKRWAYVLAVGIILITLPNSIEQLRFLVAPQNLIPSSELSVLTKLAKAPPGTIYISNPEFKNAIVPALSGKIAYYLDVDQLMVTHIDYAARREEVIHVKPQNIAHLPVDYYYIYRHDEGSPALIEALEKTAGITKFAETDDLVVFQR